MRVTAAAVISAIQAYAKINAAGEWIDKNENVNLTTTRELFSRMNREEMLRYAETGELLSWWPADNLERQQRIQVTEKNRNSGNWSETLSRSAIGSAESRAAARALLEDPDRLPIIFFQFVSANCDSEGR